MNLAITLLVALSVAAIIGTVLQQNQAYTDYIIKFGPFWFEVFKQLGLYDVYSALWFLLILFFLVLSTSVCIYKNAPKMLRDMREYREGIQLKTLESYSTSHTWETLHQVEELQDAAQKILRYHGFSARLKEGDGYQLVAGMRGAGSRLGYVLTHLAIVLICIGGLIDGNAILKLKEMTGQISPETQNIPADEVSAISRLGMDNHSFRGSVSVPEGSRSEVLFINYRDGYLVQDLPFTIEVKDFRIEHYNTGQPKSFESDLIIHDPREEETLQQTISVNHPLIYDGYSIYQASFSDGGSKLGLKAWPLVGARYSPKAIKTSVGEDIKMNLFNQNWQLEVSDFRLFNINPAEEPGKKFKNVGPSFQFKMRDKTGAAKEYLNYMLPIKKEGQFYFLSGVRGSPAENFRYLYVPMDDAGGINRFMQFLMALHDDAKIKELALKQGNGAQKLPSESTEQFSEAMLRLVKLFREDGFDAMVKQVETTVPSEKRKDVVDIYVRMLQQILGEVYLGVLKAEGIDLSQGVDESKAQFFDAASTAIGAIGRYGSPVFFQLEDFEHRQASGLQIARAPGKNLVYPGCAMLILGVFLMFYAPQQRLWVWLQPVDRQEKKIKLVLAGNAVRNKIDFKKKFDEVQAQFESALNS
ncbi:MAG: ResB-like family protein [Cycloclasticus sp. symbiont of Poecilosclerida sp. M]|nr:MAG: ResB-like family protein [Cycloclasticus sp. symbiont of Poecilosclerida sp. M]